MGRPRLPEDRPCVRCGEVKPRESYGNRKRGEQPGVRRSKCKACEGFLAVTKHYKSDSHRRRAYGMKPGEFDRIVASQGNKCAICEKTFTSRIHVDHNHETGLVRGLLCAGCNRSIAILDDHELLEKANKYLGKFA